MNRKKSEQLTKETVNLAQRNNSTFFRQQKPQDIVVFILSSYYRETFANFLIAFLSANVCKYLVLDRFIAV